MSPVVANSLLEAALRTDIGEDRTTDLLACLLGLDVEARRAFLDLVEAPWLATVEILTQRLLPGVGRVDVELRLTQGSRLHVIWIEAKVGTAAEQPRQLYRYARALRNLYGRRGTLVALAPDHDRLFNSAREPLKIDDRVVACRTAVPMTWAQLGKSLENVGEQRGGRRWRSGTAAEGARADQRTLANFLDYLVREGLVEPNDPISSTDAFVARRYYSLLDPKQGAIARLLDLATSQITLVADSPPFKSWTYGVWQGRHVPWPGGWATQLNEEGRTSADLFFAPNDDEDRVDEPRDEPAFFAALVFDPAPPSVVEMLSDPQWLLPADVMRHARSRYVRLTKLLYLSELAVRGVTLSQQAESLATWASARFAELQMLPDPRERRSGGM